MVLASWDFDSSRNRKGEYSNLMRHLCSQNEIYTVISNLVNKPT